MQVHLIRGIIISISLLVIGCCKESDNRISEQGLMKPLWTESFPMGDSKYIYNGGLISPPLYDNCLIFHTTLHSNSRIEDNRLCGMDIKEKKVEWLFPADTTTHYNYCFDSEGYIYGNYLVTKSSITVFSSKTTEEIICFDLNVRKSKWEIVFPSTTFASCREIVGVGSKCFFIQNDKYLYSLDILTGDTIRLYSVNSENIIVRFGKMRVIETETSEPKLLLFISEFVSDKSFNYILIYDIVDERLVKKIRLPYQNENYGVDGVLVYGNNIYVAIGALTICVDYKNENIVWEAFNRDFNCYNLNIAKNVLFKNGVNNFIGFDMKTGKQLYENNSLGSYWAVSDGDYIYLNGRDERIYIIDINNGNVLDYIICPDEPITGHGFWAGTYAAIVAQKIYIMGYKSIYCYPAYPWNK